MVGFKEYPRGGVCNRKIENEGEMHLCCVIIIDTSSSMKTVREQITKGLEEFYAGLDDQAKGRVEICIITFDDVARILVPFGPAYEAEIPEFDCDGMTAMHQAVDYALGEMEARKEQYRNNGTAYYRPWIFMLTDGAPTDKDNGEFGRLIQSQKDRHCTFYPVAIGENANTNLLKTLNVDGVVLKADRNEFAGAFAWLSNSLSRVSDTNPGQKVKLAKPSDYQLVVES